MRISFAHPTGSPFRCSVSVSPSFVRPVPCFRINLRDPYITSSHPVKGAPSSSYKPSRHAFHLMRILPQSVQSSQTACHLPFHRTLTNFAFTREPKSSWQTSGPVLLAHRSTHFTILRLLPCLPITASHKYWSGSVPSNTPTNSCLP